MTIYRDKSVTKAELSDKFNIPATSIKQVDHMQLFVITKESGNKYLVSYYTIVGYKPVNKAWIVTTEKHSPTTNRQLNKFAKRNEVVWASLLEVIE